MADPTTFAEFEAQGSKFTPPVEAQSAEPEKVAAPEAVEETPTEEAPQEEQGPKQSPKRKLTLQEERDKLLKEVTELRKERRGYQQQPPPAATSPAGGTALPPGTPTSAGDSPPVRPKLSTYPGTLEEWEAAVEKYEQERRVYDQRQWQREQAEEKAKAAQQRVDEEYNAKLGEHRKAHPDFDEGLRNLPELPQLMVNVCKRAGPELVQVLIDHPDETARIVSLPPEEQLFEMGQLAASLRNGNGNSKTAEPSEEQEEAKPVKVPAKLGATGTTQSAASKPNYGAKSFAEYEQLSARFAQKRPGFVSRGK